MVFSLILDAMQTLTQSLDTRRLSMLKAMGVELWWAKSAKPSDGLAPVPLPVVNERAKVALPTEEQSGASVRPSPLGEPASIGGAPATVRPAAAAIVQPAATPVMERAAAAVSAPTESATPPAVVWTMPAPWKSQQLHADVSASSPLSPESGLLLLVDDLQTLGDAQPAAMQLLENMVRAMGLLHSPALRLSWARRMQQHAGPEVTDPQEAPLADVQQLLAHARPRAVLVMGRDAAQHWLGSSEPLGALRQATHQAHGVPVVVSFSPAYLLRATHAKRQAWSDLQRVMAVLAATASA